MKRWNKLKKFIGMTCMSTALLCLSHETTYADNETAEVPVVEITEGSNVTQEETPSREHLHDTLDASAMRDLVYFLCDNERDNAYLVLNSDEDAYLSAQILEIASVNHEVVTISFLNGRELAEYSWRFDSNDGRPPEEVTYSGEICLTVETNEDSISYDLSKGEEPHIMRGTPLDNPTTLLVSRREDGIYNLYGNHGDILSLTASEGYLSLPIEGISSSYQIAREIVQEAQNNVTVAEDDRETETEAYSMAPLRYVVIALMLPLILLLIVFLCQVFKKRGTKG